MKTFFSLLFTLMLGTALGQSSIEFPFNPDSDGDGQIGSDDLLIMLSAFGEPWTLPDPNLWATGTITNLLDYESELTQLNDSLTQFESQLDSILSIAAQGLPFTQENGCRVMCSGGYYQNGGFPWFYNVPSDCSFVWVKGTQAQETYGGNYVSIYEQKIVLDGMATEGSIRSFVCETQQYYCPNLYQYIDGELMMITSLPSQASGGSQYQSENYRTVQFNDGVWSVMPEHPVNLIYRE